MAEANILWIQLAASSCLMHLLKTMTIAFRPSERAGERHWQSAEMPRERMEGDVGSI